MSNVNLFNGVSFTVESSNQSYHSYDDWGLYVTNTDCIGEPKQYTNYITIPGRNGKLDLSEAISGRQIYESREIKINLAGTRFRTNWDSAISAFRNEINGKVCKITFDNDPSYFWRGRVTIKDFSSCLNLGTFLVEIPEADPYKYDVNSSADPWLWDPFNFETGVITYTDYVQITGSGSITIPHGYMLTCPDLFVADKTGTFTVIYKGVSYELNTGSNIIPAILVGGEQDVVLSFVGNAKVKAIYKSGSL